MHVRRIRSAGAVIVCLALLLAPVGPASAASKPLTGKALTAACANAKDLHAKTAAAANAKAALRKAHGKARRKATRAKKKADAALAAAKKREAPDVAKCAAGTKAKAAKQAIQEAKDQTHLWLAIAFGAFLIVSVIFWGLSRHLFVGADNRLSTSKVVAATWTYLIASTLLGFVLVKYVANHGDAFRKIQHSGLAGQYGLVIGSPLGAAILAKGIVGGQLLDKKQIKSRATKPSGRDLIAGDTGATDLGDFQYVLFNLVAMTYFVAAVIHSPLQGLPHVPDVLLGLTSVAAVGYVGKKTIDNAPTAAIKPNKAKQGETVTIRGTGLLKGEMDTARATVKFGSIEVTPTSTPGEIDTLQVGVPPGLAVGTPVPVEVITPNLQHVKAGDFTREPDNGPAGAAGPPGAPAA
jgi:IPT/TIG domain-containing protein